MQQTVRSEEIEAYEGWVNDVARQSNNGWYRCPPLSSDERIVLFHRIAAVYRAAWGCNWLVHSGTVAKLAQHPELRTPRRWVRATVQILDLLQEAKMNSSTQTVGRS
jgi:hypothetical protein